MKSQIVFRNDPGEENKQTIGIAEKFIHQQYDSPPRANDIALLKLKEPIKMGSTISPPCIPQQNDFGDSSSFPAGLKYNSYCNLILICYHISIGNFFILMANNFIKVCFYSVQCTLLVSI